MPKPYPDPNITQASDIVSHANQLVGYSFLNFVLLAIAIIVFGMLKGKFYRNGISALIASFLTLILGSFLFALGMVRAEIIILWLVATILTALWASLDR